MEIRTPNLPKELSQAIDLTGVDVESLPVWDEDPIFDYFPPAVAGEWEIGTLTDTVSRGYWTGLHRMPRATILKRNDEVWMSVTPMEIESQIIGIEAARGHTVIFGLGLGWCAAKVAMRPEVEKVTVVERDASVRELHTNLGTFERLPQGVGEKVAIVEGSAESWRPDATVDVLIPDIWLEMMSNYRPESVRGMQDRVNAEAVYFWSQELEIARRAARSGVFLDDEGVAAIVNKWDLPLIGPGQPDYTKRTIEAARQWILGRWHFGTIVPDYLRSEADDYLDRKRQR
ncbi:MAG: hypothetical protein ACX930_14480 [Erythrobacter sp.]